MRVLLSLAHPDDEVMIGGLLLRLKELGSQVWSSYVTEGEGTSENFVDGDLSNIAEIRARELKASAHLLGIQKIISMKQPDIYQKVDQWNQKEIKERLVKIYNELQADLVITMLPFYDFNHLHHKEIGRLTIEALPSSAKIYAFYELDIYPRDNFPKLPNEISLPRDKYQKQVEKAAKIHTTQRISQIELAREEIFVPLTNQASKNHFPL